MLPASYSTVAEVMRRYPPMGSASAVTSSQILGAIGDEQARIDGVLGTRYAVPFSPVPPIIEMIAGDLAILRLIDTRVLLMNQGKPAPEWTEPWRKSFDLLMSIAGGDVSLTTASSTVVPQVGADVGELWSNTMHCPPIFVGQDIELVDARGRDPYRVPYRRWGY